jgi:hypothetical protein
MFNKLLMAVGLAKAPSPLRRFLGTKAFIGTVPALAYFGWKYRGHIAELVRHRERGGTATATV